MNLKIEKRNKRRDTRRKEKKAQGNELSRSMDGGEKRHNRRSSNDSAEMGIRP
jgi:hypothetical protein